MGRLYVHALANQRVRTWKAGARKIESVAIGAVVVVCERRSTAPPLSEEELLFQHGIVVRIASRASAVLPARFGSLVDERELVAIVQQRERTIADALAAVDGRVQMTLRTFTPTPVALTPAGPPSGKQYLERRRREASPPLPPRIESALKKVAAHVVRERREMTPAGSLAVYHLVPAQAVDAYRGSLDRIEGLTVSGPLPPFAFVPELW